MMVWNQLAHLALSWTLCTPRTTLIPCPNPHVKICLHPRSSGTSISTTQLFSSPCSLVIVTHTTTTSKRVSKRSTTRQGREVVPPPLLPLWSEEEDTVSKELFWLVRKAGQAPQFPCGRPWQLHHLLWLLLISISFISMIIKSQSKELCILLVLGWYPLAGRRNFLLFQRGN